MRAWIHTLTPIGRRSGSSLSWFFVDSLIRFRIMPGKSQLHLLIDNESTIKFLLCIIKDVMMHKMEAYDSGDDRNSVQRRNCVASSLVTGLGHCPDRRGRRAR